MYFAITNFPNCIKLILLNADKNDKENQTNFTIIMKYGSYGNFTGKRNMHT